MTDAVDTLVIGAGHNGLVCAAYLAKSGRQTVVLEAAESAGGMAAMLEFGGEFRAPGLANTAFPVDAAIRRELSLDRQGYDPDKGIDTIALDEGGQHLTLRGDDASGAALTEKDSRAFSAFVREYQSFVEALRPLTNNPPPRLKNLLFADKKTLASLAWKLRGGLGREATNEILRVIGMNIHDVLDERMDSDRLKGALAAQAIMGSSMGPRTAGTVLTWMQWLAGSRNGGLSVLQSGEKGLVPALERAARSAGAELRFNTRVQKILIDDNCVTGVQLVDGQIIRARCVVAAGDPRRTFNDLVGARHLDAMFANRVSQVRGDGSVAKLFLGLDALPEFRGLEEPALASRLLIAPSMRYVERAFNPSKYGEFPDNPVLDITLPSLADDSLASEEKHVMSVNVAFVPYRLKPEQKDAREAFVDQLVKRLCEYAPGLDKLIAARKFLTPADIESRYGVTGGHWHHGELSMHQSFMMRPLYGAARYDTPLAGLYLASAGCHPGGGLSGLPGRNAASRIIELEAQL